MRIKRPTVVAALAVTGALVLSACGDGGTGGAAATQAPEATTATSPAAATDRNDADVMFAQMMIPHHAQAIAMSDVVLGKEGVDPEVTALAEQIKAAQGPEIEQMSGWLESWGEDVPSTDGSMGDDGSMGTMDDGDGMMADDDMQALSDADGAQASTLFLEQMIEHHRGAIETARTEVSEGQNPEAVALAQAIVDAQEAEIETMQEMLAGR